MDPYCTMLRIRTKTDAIIATKAALPQTKTDGLLALQQLQEERRALQAELPPLRLIQGGAS